LHLSQIDLEHRLIDLNPKGREQTKKYRPTVKLPEQLAAYIEVRKQASGTEALVRYEGSAVESVKRSWASTRAAAGLSGNVQTYSFRHTIARWLRMQSVPAWEVAAQLGHKAPDYSTTEIYAPFDPAYLTKATDAIDLFLCQVARQLDADTVSEFLLESI
jgi:integrase